MTRVAAFVPDLLFGSQVQGGLRAVGHEVDLVADEEGVRSAIASADVLVVDLTAEPERGASLVESLSKQGLLDSVRTLAFYSHVDLDARRIAERAGFDLIVPRSRMAREGAELVTRLAENPDCPAGR
jgi:hypothetical protein